MRISDWSSDVCSSDLGQYFLADADIVEIISRGDPHAQHVRAAFGDDLQRIADIAQRFGHFTSLLVERQAIGKYGVITCAAAGAEDFAQGGMEPAAMLVGAFERSDEHPSALQLLNRISFAGFCLEKNTK